MHQFSRMELLIGKESLEKLKQSKVAVFGIGGVGSFAVEGLVRAGLGSLVLIDHDYVNITNINRQIHSTISTIGRPKVEVMRERILDINPEVKVSTYQVFFSEANAEILVQADYDYIVDAIDTVSCKIELILAAKKMGVPIISSMGAGNKLDPSKFRVSDIFSTSVCPLAKVTRRELKKRGIESLKVIYSTEKPVKSKTNRFCVDNEDEQYGQYGQCHENINRQYHKNTIGSISFVPSVAGLIIAGEVVKDLIGYDEEDKNYKHCEL
jgi:tRNA A37 threonylcarbamoyladenosine dehydratase